MNHDFTVGSYEGEEAQATGSLVEICAKSLLGLKRLWTVLMVQNINPTATGAKKRKKAIKT